MKAQIIKMNGKYAARYKRWYQFQWHYLSLNYTWTAREPVMRYCLMDTELEAEYRLTTVLPEIVQVY